MDPKEQQGHYSLAPATLQELPEWGWVQRQTALRNPIPDFSSRFTPEAIPRLSTSVMDPKEQQGHYSLAPATLQELPEWGWVQRQTALGNPIPDFSSRFTPEAIPREG